MNAMTLHPFPVKHTLRQRLAVSNASRGMSNAERRATSDRPPLVCEPVAPIRYRECRMPLWPDDAPPDGRFCGEQVVSGRSYCAHHLAVATGAAPTNPPPESKPMADQRLVSIVDRLVRLEEEKRELAQQIKDVKQESKSAGYNASAIAVIVKQRMESADQRATREEREMAVDLLRNALGEFSGTPLGAAAVERV